MYPFLICETLCHYIETRLYAINVFHLFHSNNRKVERKVRVVSNYKSNYKKYNDFVKL